MVLEYEAAGAVLCVLGENVYIYMEIDSVCCMDSRENSHEPKTHSFYIDHILNMSKARSQCKSLRAQPRSAKYETNLVGFQ